MSSKRTLICLVCGLIAGTACGYGGMSSVPEDVRTMVFISSLLNRTFIGFVIAISAWKMNWAMHGALLGLLGSLPVSIPLIITPNAGMTAFFMFTFGGIVWGFLIELFASVVFKAKMA